MDDDNVAKPNQIATFVEAMENSDADILTCFMEIFEEEDDVVCDDPSLLDTRIGAPLGGAAAIGCFKNLFGDANCMVKRNVFDSLGGFWEEYGVPKEDQDFFMRATAAEFKIEVVPEVLFYYRKSNQSNR